MIVYIYTYSLFNRMVRVISCGVIFLITLIKTMKTPDSLEKLQISPFLRMVQEVEYRMFLSLALLVSSAPRHHQMTEQNSGKCCAECHLISRNN